VIVDFFRIGQKEDAKGRVTLFPDFRVVKSRDLMVQGGKFYAVWDEGAGFWSRDPFDVARLVDAELTEAEKQYQPYSVKWMNSSATGTWDKYIKYLKGMPDSWHPLDSKLAFANTELSQRDYATKRLPYSLEKGDISAWDELLGTLYGADQRDKIEWAIGSIIEGDSKRIQKFFVFYGSAGTGKSTVLHIIQQLFQGYTASFDGKELGSSNASFAMEQFRHNPLVAIQHDGDLSRLEDNTRLNSIVSHEEMTVNEKFKSPYTTRIDSMLFIGTNQPVRISDAKSGLLRRLMDIHPTGVRFGPKKYDALMAAVGKQLGAIAYHCHQRYLEMGRSYYQHYRPTEMMFQTDPFFNFVEAHYDIFESQDFVTLDQAYKLYKAFCEDTGINRPLQRHKMRAELENYFQEFHIEKMIDGTRYRSIYMGFKAEKYKEPKELEEGTYSLVLEEKKSLLDELLANSPAQYAKEDGTPQKRWGSVRTKLADIDSHKLHYVKVEESHIVIDFDLKRQNGEKALDRNLEAAAKWPPTYAEISKSGSGVHLHYTYSGDSSQLATEYSDGIEIKVYRGGAALRRRLSKCNAVPVSEISSGLPLKEKKEKMHKAKVIKSEKGLRELVERNLKKEIHPGTKPSIDFIEKILEEAYESGMTYDLRDMRSRITAFAVNSSNQSDAALKAVSRMKFNSDDHEELPGAKEAEPEGEIAFYDVEVYPNLFVICWKYLGSKDVVKMVNPKASDVEALFKLKLVGFYNRRYDNHILYAASMGASAPELFKLSQRLVEGNRGAGYGAAYNLSYADIWDFASEKKSLKKWEVDLGILHMELDIPWDQDVPEDMIDQVVEYCANDVRATEEVFLDRKGDFIARQILAELSGLTVNDTTQNHTARIIFGEEKKPQKDFVYTDLSEQFPGYTFELGKSSYKGEDPSEGGYVYAEPGMYEKVVELDVISMHPASIEALNLFGPYTKNFSDLKEARVAIKQGDFEKARNMMGARLAPYLTEEDSADQLAYALKIVINTVYGLTSAKFDNPFRDIRNRDNIVAKRGALFMIDLKHWLQEQGVKVIHIKTDSIKLVDISGKMVQQIKEFGQQYGYEFEQDAFYEKFVLVNDAVYVGGNVAVPWEDEFPGYVWKAVGAQFQHPYVFKTLFSKEAIVPEDFYEARTVVKGAMYLDMSESDEPDVTKMRHIGKTGQFVPVVDGGGKLYRVYDGKYYAVSRTKGHMWMEAIVWESMDDGNDIDMTYFDKLKDEALETIEKFGSFDEFIKEPK